MSEWISVEDRLPEQVGDYLIHIASEDWCDSYMMNSIFFEGRFVDAIGCAPVTHWMPLPSPPRGKDDE